MAATLALLLAVSVLLPSGAELGSTNLVLVEWDQGNTQEHLSTALKDRINIPEGLSVKEVGTSKFMAVLKEPTLARLTFKTAKKVIPVEEVGDYLEKIKISVPPSADISSKNLTLIKITPSLKGHTLQQYEAESKSLSKRKNPALKNFPKRIYISKGSFPPEYYLFINMPLDDIQFSFGAGLDIFGGAGSTTNEISYLQILLFAK